MKSKKKTEKSWKDKLIELKRKIRDGEVCIASNRKNVYKGESK